MQKELDQTIFPLCHRLDGQRLLSLYQMCLMNREGMYQALKSELNVRYQLVLPIGDYLTFLHEVKQYVTDSPVTVPQFQPPSFHPQICHIL